MSVDGCGGGFRGYVVSILSHVVGEGWFDGFADDGGIVIIDKEGWRFRYFR